MEVCSEKLLAVSAAGPPAAFFPEIDISGFFGHAHFWKKCVFAQIWSDLVYLSLERPAPLLIKQGGGSVGDSPPVKPTDGGGDGDGDGGVPTTLPIW